MFSMQLEQIIASFFCKITSHLCNTIEIHCILPFKLSLSSKHCLPFNFLCHPFPTAFAKDHQQREYNDKGAAVADIIETILIKHMCFSK